jgi:spore coat protein CotH
VNAETGAITLFDYLSITPRTGGYKVHFHKDRLLNGMSTINLIFEGNERFLLAEPLAYDVYRRAGNAACRTDFVRVWLDGKPRGYHLLVEQPNRTFLRHNKLSTDGQLYKCVWFARTLVGQHEKKTYPQMGHDDLKEIVELLNKTQGDEQWAVIKKHFDVEQVINYFAVNMVLSHWDGYFNNYFTYHDVHHTGKWTMYPWDS